MVLWGQESQLFVFSGHELAVGHCCEASGRGADRELVAGQGKKVGLWLVSKC